jgi:hypothetical protein
VFVTGDPRFLRQAVLGKEGDSNTVFGASLNVQNGRHPNMPWCEMELEELKELQLALNVKQQDIREWSKSYPQPDCIELERYIFPVLHVTLGLANRLLKTQLIMPT